VAAVAALVAGYFVAASIHFALAAALADVVLVDALAGATAPVLAAFAAQNRHVPAALPHTAPTPP
jgi:hypothetical protein